MPESFAVEPRTVILQAEGRWWRFRAPARVVCARTVDAVVPALRAVEAATAEGLHAAGFLSYEAAPAFDPAMRTQPPGPLPLLWFGLYAAPKPLDALPDSDDAFCVSEWTPTLSRAEYDDAIARIKDYIAAGDTYQVNYTLRLRARLAGSAWAFFCALTTAQRGDYGAWLHLGSHILCSASPELFFRLEGDTVTCKPMKGTTRRGRWWEEDLTHARELAHSTKNRAENVMIVDMVRNDLGRIAETGSVRVARLFEVERYETLWQMTSTVTARTRASYTELFQALFPCASITGAPKVHTTALITELETSLRGAYTGAIGWLAPGRKAQFNIAIRTVQVDTASGELEYGTGGGIVWDSAAESEYAEALTKALVLTQRRLDFRLLETLLWRPGRGYYLRHGHLRRLRHSADYFGFAVDMDAVRAALDESAANWDRGFSIRTESGRIPKHRVRLLVAEDGAIEFQATPLPKTAKRPWRVALAPEPVDPADPFLYHKTTHRAVYETARAAHPAADDVLLWNPRGELTESTIANLAVRLDGRWLTPPIACGLLPGVMRAHLLQRGVLTEAVVTRDMLAAAEELALFNSVRGWLPAELRSEK